MRPIIIIFTLLVLLVIPTPVGAADWWCCLPDDCDEPWHPPCIVDCHWSQQAYCGGAGGSGYFTITCYGTRNNWTKYNDDQHDFCVAKFGNKLMCAAQYCEGIPEGYICFGLLTYYYEPC